MPPILKEVHTMQSNSILLDCTNYSSIYIHVTKKLVITQWPPANTPIPSAKVTIKNPSKTAAALILLFVISFIIYISF